MQWSKVAGQGIMPEAATSAGGDDPFLHEPQTAAPKLPAQRSARPGSSARPPPAFACLNERPIQVSRPVQRGGSGCNRTAADSAGRVVCWPVRVSSPIDLLPRASYADT